MQTEQEFKRSEIKEQALKGLLAKYEIPITMPFHLSKSEIADGQRLLPGNQFMDSELGVYDIPLLSWRSKRSFEELRKIVQDVIVEQVCLLRFSCIATQASNSLSALVYREADLCEYIGGGKIKSVFAVWDEQRSVNLILKLDTGLLCSIEISLQLPEGSPLMDRHEIIGRRGTASDRVVDTQIPQQSIYCFIDEGSQCFTDTDMELFGFAEEEIEHIRSAFSMYENPDLKADWSRQHEHLIKIVHAAVSSGEKRKKMLIY